VVRSRRERKTPKRLSLSGKKKKVKKILQGRPLRCGRGEVGDQGAPGNTNPNPNHKRQKKKKIRK
jgi:hypothetical protein